MHEGVKHVQNCSLPLNGVYDNSDNCHCSRWFAMPSPKELVNPTVTPSVCHMFQVLAERLHQLQELLSVPLFSEAWQTLASHLNQVCDECVPQFFTHNRSPVQNVWNIASLSELYCHCYKPTSTIAITSNVKLKQVCMKNGC
jgi:hypothetical protein